MHVETSNAIGRNGSNGGFIEFCDVDLCSDWLNGVWHSGCVWNSSRVFRYDASAAAAGSGQAAAADGAGFLMLVADSLG
jgi:hypothetical protein